MSLGAVTPQTGRQRTSGVTGGWELTGCHARRLPSRLAAGSGDPAQSLRVLHQLGLIGVLAVQPAEHAQDLPPEIGDAARRIPVRVTPMSLLRTGIDQMPNRFRLASQAAPTPRTTSTNAHAPAICFNLCVLVLLAVPLTWRRVVLVGAALAGFALLFPVPAVRRFYELQLPRSGLATTLAVAALGTAALAGFWVLSRRRGGGPPGAVRSDGQSEPRPGALTVTATARHPGNEVPAAARAVRSPPGKRCRTPARRASRGCPLTPVPAAAATRIRANPWRPFYGQDMTCHAYGFAGWCCAVTGALSRCTMRSRRIAAYPRVDRAPTISRSVTGSGWVWSRSRRKGT